MPLGKNEEFEPLEAYFRSKDVEVMYIKYPDEIPIEIQEEIWP